MFGQGMLFALAAGMDQRALLVIGLAWALASSAIRLFRTIFLRLETFSFCAMVGACTTAMFLGGALPVQIEALLYGTTFTVSADHRYVLNTSTGATAAVALYLTAFHYICGILACWDRPHWQRILHQLRLEIATNPRILRHAPLLLVSGTIAIAGLFASRMVAVNRIDVADGVIEDTPIWLWLLLGATPGMTMLAVIVAATRQRRLIPLLCALSAVLAALALSFASGRRAFLFALLLAVGTWFWMRPWSARPRTLLLTAFAVIPALIACWILFQATRLSQDDLAASSERTSIIDIVLSDGFGQHVSTATTRVWSDFATRAYSISFLADILERFEPEQAMMGGLIAKSGLLRAIPSAVWPDKLTTLADYTSPELPVQRMLLLLETDQAMPMAMIGYVDWWIFGALLTPLIVLAISFGFIALARWSRAVVPQIVAIAAAVTLAWNAEFDFAAAFVHLRFVAIISLVYAIGTALTPRTSRNATPSPYAGRR